MHLSMYPQRSFPQISSTRRGTRVRLRIGARRLRCLDDGTPEPALSNTLNTWRDFRAKMVQDEQQAKRRTVGDISAAAAEPSSLALWAHPLPRPEKGALLLAHPSMFTGSQQYFYQSVILLLDHDDATGSYGIILNKPSSYRIKDLALTSKMPEFEESLLFVGGDVGDGSIQMMHSVPDIEGSIEVIPGLFAGGIEEARRRVQSNTADAKEFCWYARYSGWGPGQLDSEVKAGVWYVAAASPALILSTSGKGTVASDPTQETRSSVTGREAWHSFLQHMGGDFADLSQKIKAEEEKSEQRSQDPPP